MVFSSLKFFFWPADGDVYTWGWKECVPTGRFIGDPTLGGASEKDERQNASLNDQGDLSFFLGCDQFSFFIF